VPIHQAFRFALDPSDRTRSALASHAGASRYACNWGLALVKARLEAREEIRAAALRELLVDDEVEQLARTVEVPWNLPALRRAWNLEKATAAPWWAENSKEAYSSGLDALARALEGFATARSGERAGTVGFPRLKKRWTRRSWRFTTGAWHDGVLVVADRFFPSSRTCSSCGAAQAKLSLATRTYRCEHCGLEIDRDLNAALNLAASGRRVLEHQHVAGSGPETRDARGGGHPRPRPKPPVTREDGTGSPDRTVTVASQGAAA
jgi:transposase